LTKARVLHNVLGFAGAAGILYAIENNSGRCASNVACAIAVVSNAIRFGRKVFRCCPTRTVAGVDSSIRLGDYSRAITPE
jgi:hypothetical protein